MMYGKVKEDLSNTDGWLFDYRLNSVGEVASNGCCITRKYDVSAGDELSIDNKWSGANLGVFAYDSNGQGVFIKFVYRPTEIVTIPANCTTVRVSMKSAYLDDEYIFNQTTGKYLYKGKNV